MKYKDVKRLTIYLKKYILKYLINASIKHN